MTSRLPALLLLLSLHLRGDSKFRIQYFFDQDKRSLAITDLAFPSPQRGMASGYLVDSRTGDRKPVVVVTSNGGTTWTQVEVNEGGRSLYCLDETACWMVTDRGIWFTSEAGLSWKRIRKEADLTRVFFLTREHGWALGAGRKLLETIDAGKTWKKVEAADTLETSAERTVFHSITFINPKTGIITARSEPVPLHRDVPIWMDSKPDSQREHPVLSALLETRDGGTTWQKSTISMFGRISKIVAGTGKVGLGLIEFDRYFSVASEVHRFDFTTGKSSRAFRRNDVAATDLAMLPNGKAIVVGFEPPGAIARTPVPGRVRVLESSDLNTWTDIDVDYKAVAHRVHVAAAGPDDIWIATDTGMILKLAR